MNFTLSSSRASLVVRDDKVLITQWLGASQPLTVSLDKGEATKLFFKYLARIDSYRESGGKVENV